MPCGKGQVELDAFCPADRDAEASRLAVQPIGLVLRLEHELAHLWDGGSHLPFQPPAVGLQDAEGDLEGGGDVSLVNGVPGA